MFDEAKARNMRGRGYSWEAISGVVGASVEMIRRRIDPGYIEKRRRQINEARRRRGYYHSPAGKEHRVHSRIDGDVIAERFAEIPDDTRDLTGRICGDPLPGRSALDQHNQRRDTGTA